MEYREEKGISRCVCPLCGSRIIVGDLYQIKRERIVRKTDGRVSSRVYATTRPASMETSVAWCEKHPDSCSAYWDSSDFVIDEDGHFWDYKYPPADKE